MSDTEVRIHSGKRTLRYNQNHGEHGHFASGTATADPTVVAWADSKFPAEDRYAPGKAGVAFRIVSANDYARIQAGGQVDSHFEGMGHQPPGLYVTTEPDQLREYGAATDVVMALHIEPADVQGRPEPGVYRLNSVPADRIVGTYSGALRFNQNHGAGGRFSEGDGDVAHAVEHWQASFKNTAKLRKQIESSDRTGKPPASANARALKEALERAPATDQELYRGLSIAKDPTTVLRSFGQGSTVHVAAESFSVHQDVSYYTQSQSGNQETLVVITAAGADHALDTASFTSLNQDDHEFIVRGDFTVASSSLETQHYTYSGGFDISTVHVALTPTGATRSYRFNENHDEHGKFAAGSGAAFDRADWAKYFSDGGTQVDATAALASQRYGTWAANLTHEESTAVLDYQTILVYDRLNESLRNGTPLPDDLKGVPQALDSAIDKSQLSEAVIVYRGLDTTGTDLATVQPGDTFVDHGYVSTSLTSPVAENFAYGVTDANASPAFMEIRVPAGQRGAEADVVAERANWQFDPYTEDWAFNGDMIHSNEMVLPRDTSFTIDGVQHEQGLTRIFATAHTPRH